MFFRRSFTDKANVDVWIAGWTNVLKDLDQMEMLHVADIPVADGCAIIIMKRGAKAEDIIPAHTEMSHTANTATTDGTTGGCAIIMKREAKVGDIIPTRGTYAPNPERMNVERIKSFDCDCSNLYSSNDPKERVHDHDQYIRIPGLVYDLPFGQNS